jgi:hypothetical protein
MHTECLRRRRVNVRRLGTTVRADRAIGCIIGPYFFGTGRSGRIQ